MATDLTIKINIWREIYEKEQVKLLTEAVKICDMLIKTSCHQLIKMT
jgi:hypothetical protein